MIAFLHNWNPLHLLDNALAMLRYGRGVRFELPAGAPLHAALRKLRRYGIKTYCYGMRRDLRSFRVRREQADWARYLLAGNSPRAWADKNPRAAARTVGWMGGIMGVFMGRK